MKPGNLGRKLCKVPNPAATKDEDSIDTHIGSALCVFLFFCGIERIRIYGKKTVYF